MSCTGRVIIRGLILSYQMSCLSGVLNGSIVSVDICSEGLINGLRNSDLVVKCLFKFRSTRKQILFVFEGQICRC